MVVTENVVNVESIAEGRSTRGAADEETPGWPFFPSRPGNVAADSDRCEGPLFGEGLQRRLPERDRGRGSGHIRRLVLPCPQGQASSVHQDQPDLLSST